MTPAALLLVLVALSLAAYWVGRSRALAVVGGAEVVAANGKMYISDASARFDPSQLGGTFQASLLDILEQSSTGRFLERLS